jgi:RNA polymerase sigma-70 factor (ECF subfamily)
MNDMMRLIQPLIPALRRYARSLVRDLAAADDLVQDCLERAITRWHQRKSDADVRAWTFTILHNVAMSYLRKRTLRSRHVALDAVDEAAAAQPTDDGSMRYRELLSALDALPEDQRSVLLLVSVEDLSYAEAAQVLNIPVGTVMSRVARAREKLLRATNGEPVATPARRPTLRRIK